MAMCRHQQYLGRVKHAVFQTQGTGRKRVVVATEENAVASLNLRTGEICTFFCRPRFCSTFGVLKRDKRDENCRIMEVFLF